MTTREVIVLHQNTGEIQGNSRNVSAIAAIDGLIQPGSPIGPDAFRRAILDYFNERPGTSLAAEVFEWLHGIAEGRPSKFATKRSVRPVERLKALEILARFTGAYAEQKGYEPPRQVNHTHQFTSAMAAVHQEEEQLARWLEDEEVRRLACSRCGGKLKAIPKNTLPPKTGVKAHPLTPSGESLEGDRDFEPMRV